MALDIDLRKAIASHPSKENLDAVITGMIAAAGTLEAARTELKKLDVQPATGSEI